LIYPGISKVRPRAARASVVMDPLILLATLGRA